MRSFEELISQYNVELRVLSTVEGFNRIFGREKFDLYIISVELPDGNGFSLCKKIKENPVDKNPVILLATPQNAENVRRHQSIAGTKADAYFIKPVNLKEFIGHIEDILRTPLRRKKTEPSPAYSEIPKIEIKPAEETISPAFKEQLLLEKELLEKELKALRENIETLKLRTTSLLREKEELIKQVETKEKEKEKIEKELLGYEKNLNFYREKASQAELRLKEIERDVTLYQERASRAENKLKELENELSYYKKKAEGTELKAKELEGELENVRRKLMEKEAEREKLHTELFSLKTMVSEMKEQLGRRDEEINRIKREAFEFQEEIKKNEKKFLELESTIARLKEENLKLKEENASLIKEVTSLKEEKKIVEKAVSELKKKNEEYEGRIKTLESQLHEKEKEELVEIKGVESVGGEFFKPEETLKEEEEIVEKEEIEIPVGEISEDEEITKAIDDFFTESELIPSKSFENSLNFMIESASEELSSLTTSQEKIAQKIVKLVDIYNLLFRYIFDKIRSAIPDADPQKIFNDYFTDLSEEASQVFSGIQFTEKGEINSFEISRNVMRFINDMSIPRAELDSTAVSVVSSMMGELLNFMKFTAANLLSDADTEDIKEKVDLLTSRIKSIERS